MPTENKAKSIKLQSIDVLRGIAVLAVLFVHLPFAVRGFDTSQPTTIFPPDPFAAFAHYGKYGVHLFLIISGFCIHLTWAKARDLNKRIRFLAFWKRRLLRLYPPYLATLALSLLAIFIFHTVLNPGEPAGLGGQFGYPTTSAFVLDVVLLLLLMQNLNGASQRVGNGPFWSLALEEQLYLLYFPLLWMRRNWGWPITLSITFCATIVWRFLGIYLFPDGSPVFWFVVGPAFWFAWTLGALSVEQHFGTAKLPAWAAQGWTFLLLLVCAVLTDLPREIAIFPKWGRLGSDLLFGGAFFVLVNWWARLEREGRFRLGRLAGWLGKIGVFSYSLYLTHLLVMIPLKQLMVTLGFSPVLILVLRMLVPVGVGYVFYRLVEKPSHVLARNSVKSVIAD